MPIQKYGNLSRTIKAFRERVNRIRFSAPEIFVLIVLLVFGTFASLRIPVDAGYDEGQHLLRVWEISAFAFIPNERLGIDLPFPAVYSEMSIRARTFGKVIEPDFWRKYGKLPMGSYGYIFDSGPYTFVFNNLNILKTRSVTSPPLLLPQAMVMRYLGRRSGLPALPVYYACRLAGLLSYVILTWLATRLIPFGKWILATLIVSPMALFQAATLTPDSISNGIGFLFLGGCLAVAYRENIRCREWTALAFLIFLLFLTKINLVFLAFLPFLIISPSRFKKGGYVLLGLATLILFLVEVGGWNAIAFPHVIDPFPNNANPVGQIKHILLHPLAFLQTVLTDLWFSAKAYARQWFGVYGYGYWSVPFITYVFYAVGLACALCLKTGNIVVSRRMRLGLAAVFLMGYLATVGSMYLSYTPVGSTDILGVQGRYFIPVVPLLFLALSSLPFLKNAQGLAWLAAASTTASLVCFTLGFVLSYYVPCGNKYYEGGLCYQPIYKKWTPNAAYSPPLSGEMTLTQSFTPVCDGMTELRVWVDASASAEGHRTVFLLQDPEKSLPLVDQTIPNDQLPHQGWYSMNFDPVWQSKGKAFTFSIHTEAAQDTLGPRIAFNPAAVNTAGELRIDDQKTGQNLFYQYGCIAGLEKARWSIGQR